MASTRIEYFKFTLIYAGLMALTVWVGTTWPKTTPVLVTFAIFVVILNFFYPPAFYRRMAGMLAGTLVAKGVSASVQGPLFVQLPGIKASLDIDVTLNHTPYGLLVGMIIVLILFDFFLNFALPFLSAHRVGLKIDQTSSSTSRHGNGAYRATVLLRVFNRGDSQAYFDSPRLELRQDRPGNRDYDIKVITGKCGTNGLAVNPPSRIPIEANSSADYQIDIRNIPSGLRLWIIQKWWLSSISMLFLGIHLKSLRITVTTNEAIAITIPVSIDLSPLSQG